MFGAKLSKIQLQDVWQYLRWLPINLFLNNSFSTCFQWEIFLIKDDCPRSQRVTTRWIGQGTLNNVLRFLSSFSKGKISYEKVISWKSLKINKKSYKKVTNKLWQKWFCILLLCHQKHVSFCWLWFYPRM